MLFLLKPEIIILEKQMLYFYVNCNTHILLTFNQREKVWNGMVCHFVYRVIEEHLYKVEINSNPLHYLIDMHVNSKEFLVFENLEGFINGKLFAVHSNTS